MAKYLEELNEMFEVYISFFSDWAYFEKLLKMHEITVMLST